MRNVAFSEWHDWELMWLSHWREDNGLRRDRSCGELWTDSTSILGRNIWTLEVPRGNNSCRITKHLVVSLMGRNPPICVGRTNKGRKDRKAPIESQSLAEKNTFCFLGFFPPMCIHPAFHIILSSTVLYPLHYSIKVLTWAQLHLHFQMDGIWLQFIIN